MDKGLSTHRKFLGYEVSCTRADGLPCTDRFQVGSAVIACVTALRKGGAKDIQAYAVTELDDGTLVRRPIDPEDMP